jgi:hypothetical protein
LHPGAQEQRRAEQRENGIEQKTGDIAEHLGSFFMRAQFDAASGSRVTG